METRLNIEIMKISDIKPYRNNAKKHPPEQIDQIAESIALFGFNDPLAVWGAENVIIEGHGRYLAAKKMGIEEVPVIRLDHLSDEERRAYTLIHNQLTMNSGFDLDLLNEEMSNITMFDMGSFGFEYDPEETGEEKAEEDWYDVDESYDKPETSEKADLGVLYRLGDHFLMCGDATDGNAVMSLMGGNRISLFITDPPYNVAIGSKNASLEEFGKAGHCQTDILGDVGMTDDECSEQLWKPAFRNALAVADDRCSFYMTMPQGHTHMKMAEAMSEAGWQVKHELIWVKNVATFSLGRLDYEYKHEPILYGWNKKHAFYGKGYRDSIFEDALPDIENMKKEEMKELLLKLFGEESSISVLRYDKPARSEMHPTMKPIPLFGKLISNSTQKGEAVLDLFGGSGTTLMACEQLGRRCFMMENDPHYCGVIIDRWEKFTGGKAEKVC